MREFFERPIVRRLMICLAGLAVLEVMTGPSGSSTAPTQGITNSFTEPSPFFGLFGTLRWVVFLFLALVVFGVWTLWKSRGALIRGGVTKALAVPRRLVEPRPVRRGLLLVLLVFAILLPHIETDAFWQAAMVEQIAVYVLLAMGLNVVVGFAGLLDLGYVAFYAIGAYTTAWVTGALPPPPPFHIHFDPFWAIPVAIGFAMLSGVLLGLPTLRLRGDYLAIVTLGFGEIITIFANNLYGITGGSLGSNPIPHPVLHVGPIHYTWGLAPVPYYYLIAHLHRAVPHRVLAAGALARGPRLDRDPRGRGRRRVGRDQPAQVQGHGLRHRRRDRGLRRRGDREPVQRDLPGRASPCSCSINILVLVIFGGMGSIAGVVVGAIVIQTVGQYLNHTPPSGYQQQDLYIYLGALLVIMMIFRPVGLIPSKRRRREISLSEAGEGHMDEVLTGDTP